jgi:hypothetical protein
VTFAERPKKLREWVRLRIGTFTLAVAPVIGTAPSKMILPVKNE